jgi:tetratricopeptide (TPR) repeat protein
MKPMLSRVIAAFPRVASALLISLAIVGCATVPATRTEEQAASAPAAAPSAVAEPERKEDEPPDVDLTGPLLFQIMAAEVAVQRGDLGSAYATFISVARSTRDARLARRATEVAIAARALPQALDAAQLWRALDPGSDEALQATAALLIGNGRYDDAYPLLVEQVKQAPAAQLPNVQRMLSRAPDRTAGFRLLERVAQPYADDPKIGADVRLTLAGGAFAAGQIDRALEEARAALRLRPDFERAALAAAQLLAQPIEGKTDPQGRKQAIELLQEFLARNPRAREARMACARLLVGDNRYAEAQAQFEVVIAQDPDNLDALYAAGIVALEGPPPHTVARDYLLRYVKAVEDSPSARVNTEAAYLSLARIADEERNYDEAMQWLDRIDDGEQYVNARAREALILGKLNRVEEARKLLAETQTRNDDERRLLVLTEAQLLREAQRYQESLDLLTAALKDAPDDPALLYDTAMAAEKLDRVDLMEQHLRKLMELKPDDAQAFNALGYTFADRNIRLQEAYELIGQALKLAPDDAYILDSKGWVYFRMGDLPKARDYLERAWKRRPHAEVGAHYGEVLWLLDERDDARRIWRESQKIEPDNETLKSTLKRFEVQL